MSHNAPRPASAPPPVISEVRYSLPQLMAEIEAERASSAFAMEKLDQTEIGKLFKSRSASRRGKRKN